MTEVLRSFVRHVFDAMDAHAIYSGAFSENVASLRVQQKIGFERDGGTMLMSRPRGREYPHINTVLTRDRFEALSA